MNRSVPFNANGQLLRHLLFWLFAYCLLTYIYGTAYQSMALGATVILALLPIHIGYYYLLTSFVLPGFFSGKYFKTILVALGIMAMMAILYRVTEIFITDPFIFYYYKKNDPNFTWPKLDKNWWQQLLYAGDFVNAVERSNVVVWIGITVKLFAVWHERKQAVLEAELNALKGQLHPHFLFNSLNNLYSLSLNNSPQTPEVILGLSNILRYVIYEGASNLVSLERDVEVLKDYISLEKLRYEDRLDLNINFQENLGQWKIAPLLILPLIENAFKHGVGETVDKPWINIELRVSGQNLHLKISNSKPENTAQHVQQRGGQIGLKNVQHRLKLLYPEAHQLTMYDARDCFILELTIEMSKAR